MGPDLPSHPKTARLARKLKVPVPSACLHLEALWEWAATVAPSGDISDYPAREVAKASSWTGDPETFYAALIDAGFVDFAQDLFSVKVRLHDWMHHAGSRLAKKRREAARMRALREGRGGYNGKALDDLPPGEQAERLMALAWFPERLAALADCMRNENKTGKVAPQRLVRELYRPVIDMQAELTKEQLAYGMDAAIRAGAPNKTYIRKAAAATKQRSRRPRPAEVVSKVGVLVGDDGEPVHTEDGHTIGWRDVWAMSDPRYAERFKAQFGHRYAGVDLPMSYDSEEDTDG